MGLAVVKVLLLVPEGDRTAALPRVLASVANLLKSRQQGVRCERCRSAVNPTRDGVHLSPTCDSAVVGECMLTCRWRGQKSRGPVTIHGTNSLRFVSKIWNAGHSRQLFARHCSSAFS